MTTLVSIAAGLVLLALAAVAILSHDRTDLRPKPGDLAAQFSLTTFDRAQIARQDLRGQIVVLYFWASWCDACRQEAAGLQKVGDTFQSQNVFFLGIPYRDSEIASRDFVREYRLTYPNGVDLLGRIRSAHGVASPPETFVIGTDG